MDSSENKKQKKEVGKKLRTKAFFVTIVIATLLILWAANSLAWFSWGLRATTDYLDIKVQEVESLYIRGYPADGNWQQNIFVNYFPLKPICGDGIIFFNPMWGEKSTSSLNGAVIVKTQTVEGFEAFASGETIASSALVKEFEIKTDIMTQSGSSSIFISPESYLSADLEHSTGSSLNSSALSSAHIAGAMRVAFYRFDDTLEDYKLVCIWIPNIYAKLTKDSNSKYVVVENYTVSSDGIVEYHDSWQPGQPDTSYYHDNEQNITLVTSSGTILGDNITLIPINNSTGYYRDSTTEVLYVWDLQKAKDAGECIINDLQVGEQNKIRMKIIVWLEGTDRECKNALLGGKMNLMIRFTQGN